MFDRTVANDEERQTSSTAAGRNGMDEERSGINFGAEKGQPQQSLFLCLRGKRQIYYVVRIPCYRHQPRYTTRIYKSKPDGKHDRTELIENGHYEDDSAIYKRLVAACYQFHGNWKKWVPFYGIVDVRETQFSFTATTDKEDQFEIHPLPLKHDEIKKHPESILAQQPSALMYEFGDYCRLGHSDTSLDCPANWGGECMEVELERARCILAKLPLEYHLKSCALDPGKADRLGFSTLEGIALAKSPVLSNSVFRIPRARMSLKEPTPKLPGIEIHLGWQTDRIFDEAPSYVVTVGLLLAVAWLIVVVGGIVGDANLWVAVGQLFIASFATLLVRLR